MEILKIEDIFFLKNSEDFIHQLPDFSNLEDKTECNKSNSEKFILFLENLSSTRRNKIYKELNYEN